MLIGLGVGAFTLQGQPETRADGHSSPCQPGSGRRGILEVDPASGAASLYFPLGPGIGRTGLRYNPALVGRFAPQAGIREAGDPGPVLLATTAFELSPGSLDLPLAAAGGYERTEAPLVARWTYPDGTGGSSIGVDASGLDPRSILSRFGYCASVESGCLPRRTSDPPSPPVIQGSAGEFLLTLFDETRFLPKAVVFAGDREPWMAPSGVLAVRGDLAYEYSYVGSWSRASQPAEAYAHYRLSSIRATTGEAMAFSYGENGVDFEAEWEATKLRVTLDGLEATHPVPALDAFSLGMGPEAPDRAYRDVGARLRLTYEGPEVGPGYTIIAMVRPEGPASQAPAVDKPHDRTRGGDSPEASFRSNLQVSLIQADGSEEAVQFQYGKAPSPGASGDPVFAVTVLNEITLPGRRVRLDWTPQPAVTETVGSACWTYGVAAVRDCDLMADGVEGQENIYAREPGPGSSGNLPSSHPGAGPVSNEDDGTQSKGKDGPVQTEGPTLESDTPGSVPVAHPRCHRVRQFRHFALTEGACQTHRRDRWDLRQGSGQNESLAEEAQSRIPYVYECDIPTYRMEPRRLVLIPVDGQLTRWGNGEDGWEPHQRPSGLPRIGLLGGGGGGSKGGGGGSGGKAKGSDGPSGGGRSPAGIRAYDHSHSKSGVSKASSGSASGGKPGGSDGPSGGGRSTAGIRAYDRDHSQPGVSSRGASGGKPGGSDGPSGDGRSTAGIRIYDQAHTQPVSNSVTDKSNNTVKPATAAAVKPTTTTVKAAATTVKPAATTVKPAAAPTAAPANPTATPVKESASTANQTGSTPAGSSAQPPGQATGSVAGDFSKGFTTGYANATSLGVPQAAGMVGPPRSRAEAVGRVVGDGLAIAQGAAEAGAGAGGVVVGAATGPGEAAIAPAAAVVVAHGAATVTAAVEDAGRVIVSAMSAKPKHGGGKRAKHANQDARDAAKIKYEQTQAKYENIKAKREKSPQDKHELDKLRQEMDHQKSKFDFTGESHHN